MGEGAPLTPYVRPGGGGRVESERPPCCISFFKNLSPGSRESNNIHTFSFIN